MARTHANPCTAPRPGNSNACASREYPAAQRPLHCVLSTRALTSASPYCGRNINAVIIPFSMIVGGARHEPIHRMHGMSLSTHPCQRHSVACGCGSGRGCGRVPCPCSPLGRHQHRLAAISASGRERASVPSLSVSPRVSPALAAAEGRQSTRSILPSRPRLVATSSF